MWSIAHVVLQLFVKVCVGGLYLQGRFRTALATDNYSPPFRVCIGFRLESTSLVAFLHPGIHLSSMCKKDIPKALFYLLKGGHNPSIYPIII